MSRLCWGMGVCLVVICCYCDCVQYLTQRRKAAESLFLRYFSMNIDSLWVFASLRHGVKIHTGRAGM